MTPGLADSLSITFYFLFWTAICTMIVWNMTYVQQLIPFQWLLVYSAAALFSYGTVWLSKYES